MLRGCLGAAPVPALPAAWGAGLWLGHSQGVCRAGILAVNLTDKITSASGHEVIFKVARPAWGHGRQARRRASLGRGDRGRAPENCCPLPGPGPVSLDPPTGPLCADAERGKLQSEGVELGRLLPWSGVQQPHRGHGRSLRAGR